MYRPLRILGDNANIDTALVREHTPIPTGDFTLSMHTSWGSVLECTFPYSASPSQFENLLETSFGSQYNVSVNVIVVCVRELSDILHCRLMSELLEPLCQAIRGM